MHGFHSGLNRNVDASSKPHIAKKSRESLSSLNSEELEQLIDTPGKSDNEQTSLKKGK
jgi:hypothetical protein